VEGEETLTALEVAGSDSGDVSEPLGMTTCSISIE